MLRLSADQMLTSSCRRIAQGMIRHSRRSFASNQTTTATIRTLLRRPKTTRNKPYNGATSQHSHRVRYQQRILSTAVAAPMVGYVAHATNTTLCEAAALHAAERKLVMYPTRRRFQRPVIVQPPTWWESCQKYWRMWMRLLKLAFHLAPVVAFYPILLAISTRKPQDVDVHEFVLSNNQDDSEQAGEGGFMKWYLKMCLHCVEASGAAVIKLMQWAGSRPDMFGHDFCAVFSKLQDETTPHPWSHTELVLRNAYGPNYHRRVKMGQLLGSGCIGQVYKGEVRDHATDDWKEVAIKVLHPNVRADIDADLDLMRMAVKISKWIPILADLKWLDMENVVEEFADLLQLQLDLRHEAANLERFNKNFKDEDNVKFPRLVKGFPPTRHVLVESFCEGTPVLQFAREHQDQPEVLKNMCLNAIRTVCKMIFLDNFMHGDLHPGNVFVSKDGKNFILLDVGIVAEYSEHDHDTIVRILAAFIRRQGRLAGRLMIDDSNRRLEEANMNDAALEEEKFIDKMEALNKKATGKDYLMENLGTYISYICSVAAQHHVMLNPSFISAALAVKVQEGIALALDPSIAIYKIATPIIFESERRRGIVQSAARVVGVEDYLPSFLKRKEEEEED